jgi:hypothetical protein
LNSLTKIARDANASVNNYQVVGVKDTINALNKVEPQLVKDFKAQATQIAEPAISAGKAVYTQVPLSGLSRNWTYANEQAPQKIRGFMCRKAQGRCANEI